jgi:lipopolysaccharide/colanic/teichoic acid biosynthesis glycosyltransferase
MVALKPAMLSALCDYFSLVLGESLLPYRVGAFTAESADAVARLTSALRTNRTFQYPVISFPIKPGLLLSSGFLVAVHYLAGVRWNDLSVVLPLVAGSFAASSVASRFFSFGFRGKGKPLGQNALIVGASCYEDLSERIGQHQLARPVGYLFAGANGELLFRNDAGEETSATLDRVLDANVIDHVLMVDSSNGLDPDDILYSASIRGKTFRTLMRTPLAPAGRYRTEDLGAGEYLLTHESVPVGRIRLAIKRLMDLAGSAVGLVIFAIAYLVLARRIRRETHGSAIFRQARVGRNGRIFTLYKFRTMLAWSEERQGELLEQNEMTGHMFKMRDDPRVTPLGRTLRKLYIDELPQFWNVFKGEISLVGTRPPTPSEVACYEPHHQRRLSMKPGITGLWQLYGNDEVTDFEEVVELDCRYIDTWSLWQDSRILFRTILRVVRAGGF